MPAQVSGSKIRGWQLETMAELSSMECLPLSLPPSLQQVDAVGWPDGAKFLFWIILTLVVQLPVVTLAAVSTPVYSSSSDHT